MPSINVPIDPYSQSSEKTLNEVRAAAAAAHPNFAAEVIRDVNGKVVEVKVNLPFGVSQGNLDVAAAAINANPGVATASASFMPVPLFADTGFEGAPLAQEVYDWGLTQGLVVSPQGGPASISNTVSLDHPATGTKCLEQFCVSAPDDGNGWMCTFVPTPSPFKRLRIGYSVFWPALGSESGNELEVGDRDGAMRLTFHDYPVGFAPTAPVGRGVYLTTPDGTPSALYTMSAGAHHTAYMDCDLMTGTYALWVDGVLKETVMGALSPRTIWEYVSRTRYPSGTSGAGRSYIDNLIMDRIA